MEAISPDPNKFYLGICMAGAVSAGAYTAGVMDYLLEALEEWEKRRGDPNIPTHRVEIPVVGGASAGGMTSIITAAAMQQGIQHIDQPLPDLMAERPENILYHSWVDLTQQDMFSEMLGTGDIKQNMVLSALNSDFIDVVAKRVISPQAPFTPISLQSFFSRRLKVFTTLTNLEGFYYDVNFKAPEAGEGHPYYMTIHNDYACFELYDKNSADLPTPGWIPLNIPDQVNAPIAIEAAMATGAFPVGLKSRTVTRSAADANLDPLMDPATLKRIQITAPDPYLSLNVDGGVINNEPFDKVRQVLNAVSGQDDKNAYQDYNRFNSTLIMIAPFPSSKPTQIDKSQDILNIIGLTLSAMISQMRSKPVNMVDAMDPSCAGQYLIAPSRRVPSVGSGPEESIQGEKAIACGFLGGFGGFINKEFRVHDYFLGRYNCKIFLRDYFTIPETALASNPIFQKGYAGIDTSVFKSKVDGSIQIIPVFGLDNVDFPDFKFNSGSNWPVITPNDITKFSGAIKDRVQAILLNIANFSSWTKFLLGLGLRILLRALLANAVISAIQKALTDWQLLKQD